MRKIIWDGYLFSQPDSAFYFAQLQYDLAEDVGNKKWKADALNMQGASFYVRDNYANAIDYFTRSLKLKEETGDKKGIAVAFNNIGLIYSKKGDYAKAIECHTRSLQMREEIVDKHGIAASLSNIGVIYQEQGDNAKAIDYHTRSLKMKEKIGDKYGIALALNNIGLIYKEKGEYGRAIDSLTRSLQIREEIGNKKGIAMSLNNIGLIFKIQGYYGKAIDSLTRSLKVSEETGDKYGIAYSLNIIGHIYYELGDYGKALDKSAKALGIAKEIGNVFQIAEASEVLWKVNKKLSNHKQALEMLELYIEIDDSINSMENKEAIIQQEYKYQYENEQALADAKHQEELALSAEREKRQQLIAWSAGGGLVMVLAFAFFIFNRLRVTQTQNKVIQEQKELVEEQKGDITDSIRYAENIQQALLPTIEDLKNSLPDGFVLFQPKDIVSGDFYWLQEHNNKVYLAVCDCTGHGVPGAFMSMIGSSLLDEAVVEKGIAQPNEVFYEVRKGFINALKQTKDADSQKDGMDAALITWDKGSSLQVAAAYNPVLIIRNGELKEINPDKQPVGFLTGKQKEFTHHEVALEKGDTVYMFSDGYHDQFGGSKGKKYKLSKFKKLLLSLQENTMNEQKIILEEIMREWKGKEDQVDDILVMGVRF